MMKTDKIFTSILLMAIAFQGMSQDHQALMKNVLDNNRDLRTARESYHVAILEAGTGITPPDPEIEFGYLFGNPADLGNRVDFKVSQQVEFPTAYIHKSRLKKIETSQAELKYILVRQETLYLARQLWIERIHLNMQAIMITDRLAQAEQINDHFRQKLASGEVGELAFSQSNLQMAVLQSRLDQVWSHIRQNDLALAEISGGNEVMVSDSKFPDPALVIPDSLLLAYQEGAAMQMYHGALQISEEQKSLAISQNLPKLSAGYYSESVLNQKFKGVQVGITVPLWENSKRVKQAKSAIIYAEADAERYTFHQKREVQQKLSQLESLGSRVQKLENALDSGRGSDILALSLENGEISLTDYFYASDFYFQNELLLLEYKRDQLLTEADLLKIYL
jgi:cobalt-zinc-cadmium efflux system outer membrane protein